MKQSQDLDLRYANFSSCVIASSSTLSFLSCSYLSLLIPLPNVSCPFLSLYHCCGFQVFHPVPAHLQAGALRR